MRFLKNLLVLCLAFSLTVSLFACGGDEESEAESESEDITAESSVSEGSLDSSADESVGDASADISEDDSESDSEDFSEDISENTSETTSENMTSDDSSATENYTNNTSKSDNTVSSSVEESSKEEEESSESEPENEMIGTGTKDDPYMEIPNTENMTLETISIAGSKSVHYGIYRVGGMILTINDKDAYVVYEGTRYNATNGTLTLTIANALASSAIYFEIGNSGSAAKRFTLKFSNPTGSFMNPTVVKSIENEISISLSEGDETGHYYKYIAEKNGTIRFYKSSDAESVMLITNNRNSAQRSFDEIEDGADYIEFEVKKGDEIIINVGAKPNKRGKYPAVSIVWHGEYN